MRNFVSFVLVALVGCGGNDVSISGKDPAGDAETVTNAICEWEASCGQWSIDCTSTNNMLDCTATKKAVTYEMCRMEELADVLESFQCAGTLSASETDLVEKCVNKLIDTKCISQSEIDAYIAKLEMGMDPPDLRANPAECEALEPIFNRCNPMATGSTRERALSLHRALRDL
jgi:hypothetical protein